MSVVVGAACGILGATGWPWFGLHLITQLLVSLLTNATFAL